jgi:tetratricopeptide (TPR) repeat protein/tRNA A-37 threonylcarbamoyl transferase component Bud32
MNPERWQQIKEILNVAVSLSGEARTSYLTTACGDDHDLRSEVESLLVSHDEATASFLGAPLIDLVEIAPTVRERRTRIGRRIGAYEIVEEIGSGGMGEVYRAVRADGQFVKEVALKIVRTGFDTAFVVDRLRHERQILAGLDHPNIARLLDGGTTDEGLPYLVMELVDGIAIDEYCNANGLSVAARLRLFEQVCAAVQYAHQRLVVHRDLKPSNILVMKGGVPKLLDFGIAKILDSTAAADVTLARPMTPEYASPEQVLGKTITTSSDVYALGVVLYRLLAGKSPYPVDSRNAHELARAICEREPNRPGTVRRLPADLDEIVLMALRKDPESRYASVDNLAQDIRRHLDGLPVLARRGSWKYRTGKFVSRHRVGVTAIAAIAIALVAGLVATVREARIARRQAELATIQKARAEKRFDDVRKFSDSLIFDVHDAIQSLPGATPARKLLLDRAVAYLDSTAKDAAGDPDLERELAWGFQRLAVVQGSPTESNLGDVDAALTSDRKALLLFQDVAKANPRDTIDQLNVAMMHRILAFSMLTDARGRGELEAAMAITDRLLKQGTADPRVRSERSVEFQNLALMYDAAGDRQLALDAYDNNRVLKLDILRTNPDYHYIRRSLGMASVMLGSALARVGRRDEALRMLDAGITFYESVPRGVDDVNTVRELAVSRQKRGDVLLMNGDADGALLVYRQAHDTVNPMAAADPQNTMLQLDVASLNFHEGRALAVRKQYREARERLELAAAMFEKLHVARSLDDSPRGLAAIYIWLGDVSAAEGDWKSALQRYEQASAAQSAMAASSPDDDARCELALAYAKAAKAMAMVGRRDAASATYRHALDIVLPEASAEKADVPALYVLADVYAGLGDSEKSRGVWTRIPNASRVNPLGYLTSIQTITN